MSVKLIQAIYDDDNRELLKGIKSAAMSVLQYLAWCANETQNMRCDPAIDTIAQGTHLSSRQVIRHIDELVEHKIIRIERGRGKSNRYIFTFAPSPDNHSTAELVRMGRAYTKEYPDAVQDVARVIQREEYFKEERRRWSLAWDRQPDELRKRDPKGEKLFATDFKIYGEMFDIDPRKIADYCFIFEITDENPVAYNDKVEHWCKFRLRIESWYRHPFSLPIGFSNIASYRYAIDHDKAAIKAFGNNPLDTFTPYDGDFYNWDEPEPPWIMEYYSAEQSDKTISKSIKWIKAFEAMSDQDKANYPKQPGPYLPLYLAYAKIDHLDPKAATDFFKEMTNNKRKRHYIDLSIEDITIIETAPHQVSLKRAAE